MQLFSLTRENKLLVEKLRNAKSEAHTIIHKYGDVDVKKVPFSESNLSNETFGKASEEAMSLSKSSQAGTFWDLICFIFIYLLLLLFLFRLLDYVENEGF